MTSFEELLEFRQKQKAYFDDCHILRFFSSFVAVSHGRVISVTEPVMSYCPLAWTLYKKIRELKRNDAEAVKEQIREIVERKIERFGFFTERRVLEGSDISVPYGASEILMYAVRKKEIDAAVLVCDGAGSVVATLPEVIQGIGARMNGLFYTTPITATIEKLKRSGTAVIFPDARIQQMGAVEYACQRGHKKIAVTVNASMAREGLKEIRALEKKYDAAIIIFVVCTTGIGMQRVLEIKEYADLVWACASQEVRQVIGPAALLQVSEAIPVFILTQKGLNVLSAYSDSETDLKSLDLNEQYLISRQTRGKRIRMGKQMAGLSRVSLPVRSQKEPAY